MDPARDFQLEKISQKLPNFLQRIEFSVKEDKHSTRTLSFVISRVRFKKNLPKSTLAFKGGVKLRKPSIGGKLSFILSFLFSERLHCCYICCISYWDLIKCPYFADTTERRDRGWKESQRKGEDRVTLRITRISEELRSWKAHIFGWSDFLSLINCAPKCFET